MQTDDLSNSVDKPTCYRKFDKPTSVDLIVPNRLAFSDFHLLTVAVFRTGFQKIIGQMLHYRHNKNLIMINFRRIQKLLDFIKMTWIGLRRSSFQFSTNMFLLKEIYSNKRGTFDDKRHAERNYKAVKVKKISIWNLNSWQTGKRS